MVGSQFVLIKRNGRSTLLNISQIASLWVDDVDLNDGHVHPYYADVDPALGTVYSLELLMTSRREVYFHFPNAADRDAVYEQLLAAISPALVIESNGPRTPMKASQKWSRFAKPTFPNEVFATEEEYDRAVSQVMANLRTPKAPPAPEVPPPTPRAPRKTYTRKPKDPGQ